MTDRRFTKWKPCSRSSGWAAWLNKTAKGGELGPLGWEWFDRDVDRLRPDGACQIAVFRTRAEAREAIRACHPTGAYTPWRCFTVRKVVVEIREYV